MVSYKKLAFVLIFFTINYILKAQTIPSYKNASLPIPERVQDLLMRMTPEEKFWQLINHDYNLFFTKYQQDSKSAKEWWIETARKCAKQAVKEVEKLCDSETFSAYTKAQSLLGRIENSCRDWRQKI
jgi:hypothetical protein